MYSDHYPETISGLILFDNLLSNSVRQNGINLTFLKSLFFVLFFLKLSVLLCNFCYQLLDNYY